MKRLVVLGSVLAVGLGLVAVARAGSAMIKVRPASQLEFKEVRPGFRSTVLWGDQDRGAWGGLSRAAAGHSEAWHTHSSALRLVVISGQLTVEDGAAPTMAVGPGSFIEIPANVRHRAVCGPQEECVFAASQAARYDRIPDGSASGRPGVDAGEEEAERFSREVWESP